MRQYHRPEGRTAGRIESGLLASSFVLLGLAAMANALAAAPATEKLPNAPEMKLSDDRVVLPIVIVRGYPFVAGSVAGVAGKFMLDTGHSKALEINANRVPVVNPAVTGSGFFGSGQKFIVSSVPVVKDVHVGPLRFKQVTQVESQNAAMLEEITPDFLGFLGYGLWKGYALKFDYKNLLATFYRGGSSEEYLQEERMVAALPFEIRKQPNIPVVTGKVGAVDTTVLFDTGQSGHFYIDAPTKTRMIKEGTLMPSDRADLYNIPKLELGGTSFTDLRDIHVHTTPFPASVPIGVPEQKILSLGFAFLNKFKTVWDSNLKIIYVLER